jgi:hypothetical protein
MRTLLHILFATVALGAVLGFSPAVSAQQVAVEVRSIAASKTDKGFDDDLSDLKGKLEKVFGSYSTFEQLSRQNVQLDKDKEKSITLPEGSTLTVTFHGFADDLIKLGIDVAGKLSTTLRASPGSTFFQAGLQYGDGILILAITVDKQ